MVERKSSGTTVPRISEKEPVFTSDGEGKERRVRVPKNSGTKNSGVVGGPSGK